MTRTNKPHPVFKKVSIKDLVERLDPDRHSPEPAYRFTNGRVFTKPEGQEYK